MKVRQVFVGLLFVSLLLACQLTNRVASVPTDTPAPTAVDTAPATEVQTIAPPPATAAPEPTAVEVDATATENLRVRASPSTSAAAVDRLDKGTRIQITGRTAANDWYQIPLPSDTSKNGWISAQYTTVEGPIDAVPVVDAQGNVQSQPTAKPPASNSYP